MIHVLLIEDDAAIAKIIRYYLRQEKNYDVVWARTAGEAMACGRDQFDVVLCDILLPDVNGIELCASLRQWHSCPIIYISCLDDSDTIVRALEQGGDDFIVKPFDNKVLVARIQANLRRAGSRVQERNRKLEFEGFCLDLVQHTVLRDMETYKLSDIEYRILSLLIQNANRYFTAEEIYRAVWGSDHYGDVRTVLVHIHNLRKKIERIPSEPVYLKSEWGHGYLFAGDP
ncbi:MAG: response regulator transcription factor [Lachnospiraceae bacterium]|nr:response regulator transcription factor [Lachnospiraceae bacterium]